MESVINNTERNTIVSNAIKTDGRRLLGFIRKRVRTEEDAEDILQDVFYQLIRSYNITEPIEKLTSWLFTAAGNKIIDWYRKRKTESESTQGVLTSDENGELYQRSFEDILFDPSENPEDIYFRSLVWTEIDDALNELPVEQSTVFIMHEFEGKSFNEIAELTGEQVSTLLSRKRYAVLYLRERLRDFYNEL